MEKSILWQRCRTPGPGGVASFSVLKIVVLSRVSTLKSGSKSDALLTLRDIFKGRDLSPESVLTSQQI
jgi:hypothetical protein